MQINVWGYAGLVVMAMGGTALAQGQPLSVIDWLDQNATQSTPVVAVPEPPVVPTAQMPVIQTTPLDQRAIRQIGLVPAAVTGLPAEMWRRSDVTELSRLLMAVQDLRLPAAQALLYKLLLTEAEGPEGDAQRDDTFALTRVATLVAYGALDPAMALIEQAGTDKDAAHFATYMDIALLTGDEDAACDMLLARPHLSPSYGHHVFCSARLGDWDTASLLWDAGLALQLIRRSQADLLDRFLHPDFFEDADTLQPPSQVTPLVFRLHETIGEPLPTARLPRAYAAADLRDLAGWKAQLEAAERLTRSGALPDNKLLGIYTDRLPAASGGVWDRVSALQRFETALGTGSVAAVEKTLPVVWAGMQQAEIEVSFAALFADALAPLGLSGSAATIAQHVRLLSPNAAAAARQPSGPGSVILNGVALGSVDGLKPRSPLEAALQSVWASDTSRHDIVQMSRSGRQGEALLRTLRLLEDGANGDLNALTTALGTLRALGFEDIARHAALQVALLDRER